MNRKFEMNRRQVLVAGAALGLGAALPSRLRAATPKQGGHFRIGIADFSTSDSLDPTLYDTKMQMNLWWQLRNNLIEVGPGGVLVPELALSWEPSTDARTWTIKLRQGVEFHDGRPFTAADAVYSLNLHRAPDTTSSSKPLLASISELKAVGRYELRVELSEPNVDFPPVLGSNDLNMVPDGEKDFSKGIGTGGYILENFEPGQRSLVKRNPNYWKEGRAHFDSVEMIGMSDANARITALTTGDVDAINSVDLKLAGRLASQGSVQVLSTPSKSHYGFAMRMDTPPFDSLDMRLALKYAIDREAILKTVVLGYGALGNDQPINGAYPLFDPSTEKRSYDPDKARFHFKKSGYDGGPIAVHVSDTPFAGAVDTAQLYLEHAKKAGIALQLVREPQDGYWSNVWAVKPFFATRWSGRPSENIMFTTAYSKEALKTGWNETHMSDDRLDELLRLGRQELDAQKRREIYGELQSIVHDRGGLVAPVFANFVDGASAKVGMGERGSDWDLDGARAAERWWFA
ncbi:peptide/nickel transport system substrate-binding protein [Tistlia consotensis]|uniref:Peptide/nickel transport system substrate-binding protein n=1 Tax=Tistlia consotensis USBA 355 TaxID=560819 RepID=A0A1Y6BA00_9PROT|nr:ABC transporter substrate-binding protein [Tistlia consotensis]SME99242.1 peptide/nickel transport system substrate-binding protein [Tistlia consotensis USBA 355]SNR77197.1 peptide/nickel transport system substrate-binding protein [Tistlia consotensis]